MKQIRIILLTLALCITSLAAHAQHTFGVTAGYGSGSESIFPEVEGRAIYGLPNFGVSWRTYSEKRVVGCFGIDLQYMQRGFSFSPATITVEGQELHYYTRKINSLVLPLVWQPHAYILDHRVRIFFDAAATFSYDLSSTYDNDFRRHIEESAGIKDGVYSGKYDYKTARDNRLGYGLAGGGGLALLTGRFEILARIRYYFGLSDVVRNRNKYYDNGIDGYENPFSLSPIRSSINNLAINFGVNYHFGREGFDSWQVKSVKVKMGRKFDYKGE